eukprot:scaffold164589_cov18-Tisochrysis_lutea.AAC.1
MTHYLGRQGNITAHNWAGGSIGSSCPPKPCAERNKAISITICASNWKSVGFTHACVAAMGCRWRMASALTARHIGGAVNYMAVSETLSIPPSVCRLWGGGVSVCVCVCVRAR